MIVLDTNVASELMKRVGNLQVLAWIDKQGQESLYLPSIVVAELSFGIEILPVGRRKEALRDQFEGLMELFEGRVLSFDAVAAREFARLAGQARVAGRGFPHPDAYIAAIAAAQGFAVATRDTAPFEAVGVEVINPWLA